MRASPCPRAAAAQLPAAATPTAARAPLEGRFHPCRAAAAAAASYTASPLRDNHHASPPLATSLTLPATNPTTAARRDARTMASCAVATAEHLLGRACHIAASAAALHAEAAAASAAANTVAVAVGGAVADGDRVAAAVEGGTGPLTAADARQVADCASCMAAASAAVCPGAAGAHAAAVGEGGFVGGPPLPPAKATALGAAAATATATAVPTAGPHADRVEAVVRLRAAAAALWRRRDALVEPALAAAADRRAASAAAVAEAEALLAAVAADVAAAVVVRDEARVHAAAVRGRVDGGGGCAAGEGTLPSARRRAA